MLASSEDKFHEKQFIENKNEQLLKINEINKDYEEKIKHINQEQEIKLNELKKNYAIILMNIEN